VPPLAEERLQSTLGRLPELLLPGGLGEERLVQDFLAGHGRPAYHAGPRRPVPYHALTVGGKGRRDVVGGLIVAATGGLFGAVVVLGRSVAGEIPVTTLLAIRFGVAAVVLGCWLVVTGRGLRPQEGEWLALVGLGAIGYAVESALFFLALERGTAATVTLLFYTYPVWVAVLGALTGLGMPGLLLVGALVAAVTGAGIVAATGEGLDISTLGIVFSLASAVAISFYLVAYEGLVRRTPALVAAMWVALGAAAAQGAYAVVSGTGSVPADGQQWLTVVAMGVLTSAAFAGLLIGVQRLGSLRTAIVSSLEPVFAAVLALLFLGEALQGGVFVGGLLILAGATAATVARSPREPEAGLP
jgi:drug/metabolite transporter (DMT)-like permease